MNNAEAWRCMVYRQTEQTKQRKAGTRERILAEARSLVLEGGFAAASVAAVAQQSNIAIGTLYRHFPSKGELMAEVFRQSSKKELDAVVHACQLDSSSTERMRKAVQVFATRALKSPRLAYALIAEPADPLVEAERLRFRFAYAEAFEDLIEDGVESHEFAQQSAHLCAAALVGMLAESLVGPLSPQLNGVDKPINQRKISTDVSENELLDEITKMALRAVGAIDKS